MTGTKQRLQEAFSFLSEVVRTAFRDPYLLSNQVLSKNPFTNRFLDRFVRKEEPPPVHSRFVLIKILRYYIFTAGYGVIYLLYFLAFALSRQYRKNLAAPERSVLIDIFCPVRALIQKGEFEDSYFPGLSDYLRRHRISYVYLPIFTPVTTPWQLFAALKILRRQSAPVLTEFQLLTMSDLVRLFYFGLTYPFHVLEVCSQPR